jgi:hypothetical protein
MLCFDCKINTKTIGEYYMIHNHLWPKVKGFLCIGCLETRIDRKLEPSDFTNVPVNNGRDRGWWFNSKSERLWNRLGKTLIRGIDYLDHGIVDSAKLLRKEIEQVEGPKVIDFVGMLGIPSDYFGELVRDLDLKDISFRFNIKLQARIFKDVLHAFGSDLHPNGIL